MSLLGEERRQRHAPALGNDLAEERRFVVVVELRDPDRVDGRTHRGNPAVGEHLHVVDAVGVQRGHGPAGGRPEADHDGAQPAAIVAGGPRQCEGVQHGAVAGELVVLVEDVEAEAAVAGPVVHRLESDQRQFLVDGQLGDGPVLHAVRPAPEDLPVAELGQVLGLRLRQEDDVGGRQQLLSRCDAPHERRELGVGKAEALAVAFLEDQPVPDFRRDAVQVQGVDGEAPLVGFPRAGEDAEGEVVRGTGHFFLGLAVFAAVTLSRELAGAEAALLSARFSLMDLPDFLDAA